MEFVNVIFDTDLGSDCDDAGALAVLHALERRGEARILAATHCTSTPGGAACVDTINRYYGRGDIPMGRLTETDLSADPSFDVYGSIVAETFLYNKDIKDIPCATETLRRVLAEQPAHSVTLAAVGPLRNIARLLTSDPDEHSPLNGVELVRQTVKELVVMGGAFMPLGSPLYNPQEFNIACDIPGAQTVVRLCPVPIVFSGSEIGHQLITGQRLYELQDPQNPVWYSYFLHRQYCLRAEARDLGHPEEVAPVTMFTRPSWDQSAVLYAVRGAGDDFDLSPRGVVEIDDNGTTHFREDPNGLHRFIRSLPQQDITLATIDELMLPVATVQPAVV